MNKLSELKIDVRGHTTGKVKTYCPQCRDTRRNKRDKSLSVDLGKQLAHCHHCGWSVFFGERKQNEGNYNLNHPLMYNKPIFRKNNTTLSDRLVKYFMQGRCITQDVLVKMQITEQEEYMPQTEKKENTIGFNYFEDGTLVNTKFRDRHKNFKMVAGAELIPYNISAIRDTDECIVTEGEMDALSFMVCGREDVVSVPNGAGSNLTYLDRFIETHFENKTTVYIAVDTDAKGLELRAELIRRFGEDRCRIVTYGEGCKDANEHLVKFGKESLSIALANAREVPLEGVFTAADVREELSALLRSGMPKGETFGWDNLDKYLSVKPGFVMTVTGIPGSGKSEFVDEMVLRLSMRHGWRTAYFSPENFPITYHLQKLVSKITGRRFNEEYMPRDMYERAVDYLTENISSIFPEDDFTVGTVLNKAKALVRRRGIRILVIDPYNRIEHQIPKGESETQYISRFLDEIGNFAKRTNTLVILVAHPTKLKKDPVTGAFPAPSLYDINGSAAFFNKTDFGISVERDMKRDVTRIHVLKVKFRHLGQPGKVSFRFSEPNGRYAEFDEPESAETREPEVKWDNEEWGVDS